MSEPAQTLPDPLNQHDPIFMETFDQQYALTWGEGAIPAKYKELTGIALSITGRCEPCLLHHLKRAVAAGATRREIVDMVRVSILSAGSITIPIARLTYAMLDELGVGE